MRWRACGRELNGEWARNAVVTSKRAEWALEVQWASTRRSDVATLDASASPSSPAWTHKESSSQPNEPCFSLHRSTILAKHAYPHTFALLPSNTPPKLHPNASHTHAHFEAHKVRHCSLAYHKTLLEKRRAKPPQGTMPLHCAAHPTTTACHLAINYTAPHGVPHPLMSLHRIPQPRLTSLPPSHPVWPLTSHSHITPGLDS